VTRYRILAWRGIPAQVKVFREDGRGVSVPLSDWFIQEIDRVAMREGLTGSDEYLEQWKWSEDLERPGTPEEVAAAVVAELEAEWTDT
jgi:Virulence factor